MTQMKFSYKLGQQPSEAVARIAPRVYEKKGASFLGIAEYVRTKALEDEDPEKEDTVWVRVENLEIFNGEQEHIARNLIAALYLQRTAQGTLTDADDVAASEQTLNNAQGLITGHELARLKAGLDVILDKVAAIASDDKLRDVDFRRELKKVLNAGRKVSAGAAAAL